MDVLEKILEEINAFKRKVVFCKSDNQDYKTGYICALSVAEGIVAKFMDEVEMFEFDFNRVKSFDCQCGRRYVNTYNDGWIPVEEGLPEETGYYLVQLSRKLPNEDYSDRVVVLYNGEDKEFMCYASLIIAWQPLPEPYRHKDIPTAKNTQQEMEDFWMDK